MEFVVSKFCNIHTVFVLDPESSTQGSYAGNPSSIKTEICTQLQYRVGQQAVKSSNPVNNKEGSLSFCYPTYLLLPFKPMKLNFHKRKINKSISFMKTVKAAFQLYKINNRSNLDHIVSKLLYSI